MRKFLSLVFLYNRASYKKVLPILAAVPLCFLAIFFFQIGNPHEAEAEMLMERAFGGFWAVLIFLAANLTAMIAVVTSLNGKKELKATHATTGYTVRRLRMSPIASYLTMFVYYIAVIAVFWGTAIASLYIIGRMGLTMAGATAIETKLALGMLRTDIGHALIPIAHPMVIAFNLTAVLALAGECAKSCYLTWHNGTPSAGVVLVIVPMFLVWMNTLENTYIFLAIVLIFLYAAFSFGDVISREKRPKGDPFRANKYAGIMDLDSDEFDDSVYAPDVNSAAEAYDPETLSKSLPQLYGNLSDGGKKGLSGFNPARLRRRFMPLGINMERANALFGAAVIMGIAEHTIFYFRYITQLNVINSSIKGISITAGVKMPYFWELQQHTYYGYILGILLVLFLQAYWNYEYYNKTNSVYVMKRLPDRKEYVRTIWTAPAIQAVSLILIMAAHTVSDVGVYILGTPEIALYPDYLSHMLPF